MRYILDRRFRLRGWKDRPAGLYDTKYNEVLFPDPEAYLLLMKCDGAHEIDAEKLNGKQREAFEKAVSKPVFFFLGGFIGLLFMGVTQLPVVKELPYIFQNTLSLFTIFPLAIAALTITKRHLWLVNNWVFEKIGQVSFEIYLVHAFTMEILQESLPSFFAFLGLTTVGVGLLHMLIRKGNQIWSI